MLFMGLKGLYDGKCTCRDYYFLVLSRSNKMSLLNFGILMFAAFNLASLITYFKGLILKIGKYVRMLLMVCIGTGAAEDQIFNTLRFKADEIERFISMDSILCAG